VDRVCKKMSVCGTPRQRTSVTYTLADNVGRCAVYLLYSQLTRSLLALLRLSHTRSLTTSAGTQFTCFTCFTCFTGTKNKVCEKSERVRCASVTYVAYAHRQRRQVLDRLLALLVQTYKLLALLVQTYRLLALLVQMYRYLLRCVPQAGYAHALDAPIHIHAVYLLYWYKGTNTDFAAWISWICACSGCSTYADVC
jgi:hypothetical protein